jgi:hypothetical protein
LGCKALPHLNHLSLKALSRPLLLGSHFGHLGLKALGRSLLFSPDLGDLGCKALPHLNHLSLKALSRPLLLGPHFLDLFLLLLKVANQPLLLFWGHGKGLKISLQF